MAVWRNTTYGEKNFPAASPRKSYAHDGSRIQREIYVGGDTITEYQAVADFLGYPSFREVFNTSSPPVRTACYVSRVIPHAVKHTDRVFLYCQSVTGTMPVTGPMDFDAGAELSEYEDVKLSLEYRDAPYEIVEDAKTLATSGPLSGLPDEALMKRYISRVWKPAGRVITIPGVMYYLNPPGRPIVIPVGFPIRQPRTEMTYCHHQLPLRAIPYKAINLQLGTVNSALFDAERWNWRQENALFIDAQVKEYTLITGERGADLYLKFLISPNVGLSGTPQGWNYGLYRIPGTALMDYLEVKSYDPKTNTEGSHPYASSDFKKLFRPDQP